MKVRVNGIERELWRSGTVAGLLDELGVVARQGTAVVVNGRLVPPAEHERTRVRDGDSVEIVQRVGG